MYKTILLDADDTLLDFTAGEKEALKLVFQKYGYSYNSEIKEIYEKINKNLWKRYELGEIDRKTVIYTRFGALFQKIGIKDDGIGFEDDYQELLGKQHFLIEGAIDLLKYLYGKYELYIVTNGVTVTQYQRLKESGVDQYMKNIFVSEETGFQKPRKEFFEYCFKRIGTVDPAKTIIIGDSLTSDMQGGVNAGIATCWYNPNSLVNTLGIPIDYEIKSLEGLKEIL